MKQLTLITLVLAGAVLSGCGVDKEEPAKNDNEAGVEPIALGTDIKDVIKPAKPEANEPTDDTGVTEIKWEDLVPESFRPEKVMQKYQAEVQAAPEGSKEERALYEKIMGELNSAGPNLALNGKTIRMPGFVSPLENDGEMVGDFLLVPYFGSCIHSPPPPVNQTVMVSPEKGKSVSLSKISRPVWVVGELQTVEIETDLATAGYQIRNARIEPYIQPAY